VVVTWCGGAQAVKRNQWDVLQGRDVIIWPDADAPGRAAGAQLAEILSRIASRVRVITPDDQLDGWDVADAIATPWDAKEITSWATQHIKTVWPADEEPPAVAPKAKIVAQKSKPVARSVTTAAPAIDILTEESAFVHWGSLQLDTNEGGVPLPTLANASKIIQLHPQLKGRIWFDSFRGKIYQNFNGQPAEWSDDDDAQLTVMIQHSLKLSKFNLQLVSAAVGHAARRCARNSVTDYLNGLEWDGIERLSDWLADCLGVERNEYTMAVARNWPIGMVARAFVPGCKMDTMPVLEGTQGLRKSSFLEALGSPWYASIPTAFGEKDFLRDIQGNWLVEIPDMTGFSRRDSSHILATLAIQNDVYRAPYGRRTLSHPRVATFAATSESRNYLRGLRGRRRYWPLSCTAIDLDVLRAQKDQIFAEAVKEYRAGATWYEVPGQADQEQRDRAEPDLWSEKVLDYAEHIWEESKASKRYIPITSARILSDAIELPLAKQTDAEKSRIHTIMEDAGWVQVRDPHRRWKKVERV
jgi:predicted P-loop ATPase